MPGDPDCAVSQPRTADDRRLPTSSQFVRDPFAHPQALHTRRLLAVAVTSRSNAWAVGYYFNASYIPKTLVEHWNGHSWKQVASPDPAAPGMGNQLNDVAATSATDAWAVGTFVNASHVGRSLLLHWNGTRWRVVSRPDHRTNTECWVSSPDPRRTYG